MELKRRQMTSFMFLFTTLLVSTIFTTSVVAAPGTQSALEPATKSSTNSSSTLVLSDVAAVEPIVEDAPAFTVSLGDEQPQQQERVSPLAALFRFLFGNRRRDSAANQNEREGRIGTTANKPLVTYGEQSQQLYVQVPTKTSGFSSLANQPRVATVRLLPAPGRTTAGRVVFFQENLIQSVSLHGTISALPASQANLKLEIRTSNSDDCATLGPLFNPTGVLNGGIITTTGTSTAGGLWNFYTTALPMYRISLYDPNSILGRSLVVSQNNVPFACGRILAT